MQITLDQTSYKQKPTLAEAAIICNNLKTTTISTVGLIEAIEQGQSFSPAIFKRGTTKKTKENFDFANCIVIDIDHTNATIEEIKNILKFTLIYPSFSNEGYHIFITFLGYGMNTPEEYTATVNAYINLLEQNGIKGIDHTCNQPQRFYYGTNQKCTIGEGYYTNDEVKEIKEKYGVYLTSNEQKKQQQVNISATSQKSLKTQENGVKKEINHSAAAQLLYDAKNMSAEDLMYKYNGVYEFITKTTTDKIAERKNYYTLATFRRWYKDKQSFRKYKIGSNRRSRLYLMMSIIKNIKPTISFEELLYNAIIERKQIFVNTDNKLSDAYLWSMCKAVYNKINFNMETKTRIVTNKTKCEEAGISYQKAVAMYRKNEKVKNIMEVYNHNMTLKQNYDYINELGIKISLPTLRKYLKNDLEEKGDITAKMTKKELVLNYYDFNKKLKENLQIFEDNNIKITKPTLIKYLREITGSFKWRKATVECTV